MCTVAIINEHESLGMNAKCTHLLWYYVIIGIVYFLSGSVHELDNKGFI